MDNISVLLVDDEEDFLDTLVKRLRRRNVDAYGARSGAEALQFVEEKLPDVVILDVKMPGMTGIETLRRLKILHPLLEVIMLTGHANMEVAIEGMELGAFDYMIKPIEIDELLYKVQDAFRRKNLQQEKIKKIKDLSASV